MLDEVENNHEKPEIWSYLVASLASRSVVAIWISFSALLTIAGPFGTYSELDLIPRAAYWSLVLAASLLISLTVSAGVRSIRSDLGEWQETLVVGTIFTAIFAPFLYLLNMGVSEITGNTQAQVPLLNLALFIMLVPPLLTSIKRVFISRREDMAPQEAPRLARLAARLEPEAPGRIMRMTVRDHYVDVWTDQGFKSVLMRFSDAIADAEDTPGLQVHRSHWVALDAVKSVEKSRGRVFLHLKCGTKIPVSRGYQAQVEQAGLLQNAS